ncbi:hypothetical protein KSF78_0006011 [Schistosoma japonicum]|nr:hypothetical protein KSF78_0006011 [Schistosoma japonicum]KAH8870778.1 hypothetical protein KSF78_0006011 [Schistosoma japonicum]
MRVLELYSGIGGMHFAFQMSTLKHEVVAAIEINDIATDVYKHNFPNTLTLNRVIESFSANSLCSFNSNVWSLCPPCQPFTRLGKRMCEVDNRSSSFFHVLDLISILKPEGIILENVKGFENSEPWRQLMKVLNACDYEYRQFLLSPLQFGIPNCRLRFYLVARSSSSSWNSNLKMGKSESIDLRPPIDSPVLPGCRCASCCGLVSHIEHTDDKFTDYIQFCLPVSEFLLTANDREEIESALSVISVYLILSDHVIKKHGVLRKVIQNDWKALDLYYESNKENKQAVLQYAEQLKLRFFHSREVANMLCFPKRFDFPERVTEKQRLRLLGNSVNVLVVSHLIYWAFAT